MIAVFFAMIWACICVVIVAEYEIMVNPLRPLDRLDLWIVLVSVGDILIFRGFHP